MKIVTDLHAHTLASGHAFNTINEMMEKAAERKFELVALTEHAPEMPGTCHTYYFSNLKDLPREICGVKCLFGAELNILNARGEVDLPESVLKGLDIGIGSLHGPCFQEDRSLSENTKAYIAAMQSPYIQIIGHPDNGQFPVDFDALAKEAARTGTLLELNNGSLKPGSFRVGAHDNAIKMLAAAEKYGAQIAVNSDAHVDALYCRVPYCEDILRETCFPEELVASTSAEKIRKIIEKKKTWQ